MRCIICANDKPPEAFQGDGEHVFPAAIGGVFVINTVCRPCNNRLGADVDSALTDHWIIQLVRMHLKLPGRSGAVPNPLAAGHLVNESTAVHVSPTDRGFDVRVLPRAEVVSDGRRRVVADPRQRDEAVAIVNKIIVRAGGLPLAPLAIEAAIQRRTIENPTVQHSVRIDLTHYKRPILKIAYELASYWLGSRFLDDPTARLLRDAMFDREMTDLPAWSSRNPVKGQASFANVPTVASDVRHQACIFRHNGMVLVAVLVFHVFEATIVVSEQPDSYPGFVPKVLSITSTGDTVECDPPGELGNMLRSLAP